MYVVGTEISLLSFVYINLHLTLGKARFFEAELDSGIRSKHLSTSWRSGATLFCYIVRVVRRD
jgi:hypothetical protein